MMSNIGFAIINAPMMPNTAAIPVPTHREDATPIATCSLRSSGISVGSPKVGAWLRNTVSGAPLLALFS